MPQPLKNAHPEAWNVDAIPTNGFLFSSIHNCCCTVIIYIFLPWKVRRISISFKSIPVHLPSKPTSFDLAWCWNRIFTLQKTFGERIRSAWNKILNSAVRKWYWHVTVLDDTRQRRVEGGAERERGTSEEVMRDAVELLILTTSWQLSQVFCTGQTHVPRIRRPI